MSASRPSDGRFRVGLMVATVVVLTAACGTIDVVSSDGSTGSGGALGAGGGGMGGSNHGSGGNGGTSGGGSGGTSGGGSGGMTGSGGAGVGGAGGSGLSCSQLQKAFQIALADAKSCVVGATGYCGAVTSDKLDCGCPTHVNDTKNIDPIRTEWAQGSCSQGTVCPNLACLAYKSGTCTLPSGSSDPVCTDSLSLPTP